MQARGVNVRRKARVQPRIRSSAHAAPVPRTRGDFQRLRDGHLERGSCLLRLSGQRSIVNEPDVSSPTTLTAALDLVANIVERALSRALDDVVVRHASSDSRTVTTTRPMVATGSDEAVPIHRGVRNSHQLSSSNPNSAAGGDYAS
jgi:hypothetical protein